MRPRVPRLVLPLVLVALLAAPGFVAAATVVAMCEGVAPQQDHCDRGIVVPPNAQVRCYSTTPSFYGYIVARIETSSNADVYRCVVTFAYGVNQNLETDGSATPGDGAHFSATAYGVGGWRIVVSSG